MTEGQSGRKKQTMGQILLNMGKVQKLDIQIAMEEQKRTGTPIGEILMRNEIINETDCYKAIAHQFDLEFTSLEKFTADPSLIDILPVDFIQAHSVVPLSFENEELTIAISDPAQILIESEIRSMTGYSCRIKLATTTDLTAAVEAFAVNKKSYEELIEEAIERYQVMVVSMDDHTDEILGIVVQIFDNIVKLAYSKRATDVHIEPDPEVLRTRFRVDGKLILGPILPKSIHMSLVSRIKIVANLKIAETRFAQDGKIIFDNLNRKLDLRISIIPTVDGESVVIRILERTSLHTNLQDLGMSDEFMTDFSQVIKKRNGIILITGPTGSGKTTTLSSTISFIKTHDTNILTIEDPVEYEIPFVRQIQVDDQHGITFESGMRALLRHDPDIILLGEMRDLASAQMAVRASMTGHLVFSTLHTNNAVDALPRLFEMGIPPFILSTALRAVVAQRLARKICTSCIVPEQVTPDMEDYIRSVSSPGIVGDEKLKFFKGGGCSACNGTGFYGRVGVYEILMVTPEIRKLIIEEEDSAVIRSTAAELGMNFLVDDAVKKAKKGIIALSELFPITLE